MQSMTLKNIMIFILFDRFVIAHFSESSKRPLVIPNPLIGSPPIIAKPNRDDSIGTLHIDSTTSEGWPLNRNDAACFTLWAGASTNTPMSINHHSLINRQLLSAIRRDTYFEKKQEKKAARETERRFSLFLSREDVQCVPKDQLTLYREINRPKQLMFITDGGASMRASGNVFMFPTLIPHAAMQVMMKRCDRTLWAQVQYSVAGKVLLVPLKNVPKVRCYQHVKDALRAVIQHPIQPVGVKLPRKIVQFLHALFAVWRKKDIVADDSMLITFSHQIVESLNDALASIARKQLPSDETCYRY